MSTPVIDAWELVGFPGRLSVAAYLTADQMAAQYRVLVDVLLDAQEHSLTGIGRDELLASCARANRASDRHGHGRPLDEPVTVCGAGVDSYSPPIRNAIEQLDEHVTDGDWRAMALSGVDAGAAEDTVQVIAQGNKDAAQTLAVWFGAGHGQALRLRRQVRDAVAPPLRGSRALLATGGRVIRRAELLHIAAAVESANTDAAAWRVWCARRRPVERQTPVRHAG